MRFFAPLILLVSWIVATALVDFLVAPRLFQQIPDFFVAGHLGLSFFQTLNSFEFLGATVLIIVYCSQYSIRKNKITLFFSFLLLLISGSYLFYLTPKISHLTGVWEYAESIGQVGAKGISDVQQLHRTYHQTYIGIDSLKLFILLGLTLSELNFLKRKLNSYVP